MEEKCLLHFSVFYFAKKQILISGNYLNIKVLLISNTRHQRFQFPGPEDTYKLVLKP